MLSSLSVIDLIQNSEIRFEQKLDVVDAVLQHRDTVDTDTECQARIYITVDTAAFKYLLVYDTGTEDLDPACSLTELAALTMALEAADVDLDRRLCEREVRRAETGLRLLIEDLLYKFIEHALQVAECDALINDETFHLGEHRRMRRVIVGTEYLTGRDDLDRRFLILHNMDLTCGSLCS